MSTPQVEESENLGLLSSSGTMVSINLVIIQCQWLDSNSRCVEMRHQCGQIDMALLIYSDHFGSSMRADSLNGLRKCFMHPPYSICKAHWAQFLWVIWLRSKCHLWKNQLCTVQLNHPAVMIESHLILFRDHKSHMTFPLEKIRAFSVVDWPNSP